MARRKSSTRGTKDGAGTAPASTEAVARAAEPSSTISHAEAASALVDDGGDALIAPGPCREHERKEPSWSSDQLGGTSGSPTRGETHNDDEEVLLEGNESCVKQARERVLPARGQLAIASANGGLALTPPARLLARTRACLVRLRVPGADALGRSLTGERTQGGHRDARPRRAAARARHR